ncbi:MAG: helix-turn-helix domain-containing protein [Muribaculaceae bacterium]
MEDKILDISIGNLKQIEGKPVRVYNYEDKLGIIVLQGEQLNWGGIPDVSIPLTLDSFNIIITTTGSACLEVDYNTYSLEANTIMNLIGFKTLRNCVFSNDYHGYHIMVEKSFYDDVFKEGKHFTPETAMLKTRFPYDKISNEDCVLLKSCIENLIQAIGRKEHIWYRRIVENELRRFFMEIGDIIIRKNLTTDKSNLPDYDILFYHFMRLVRDYSGQKKSVGFYAEKLCLSPDYLSKAIKEYSAHNVTYWINDVLIQNAKNLLLNRNITLQEIADRLNLADQSSFGRFFKNNTGQSPGEYRKKFR